MVLCAEHMRASLGDGVTTGFEGTTDHFCFTCHPKWFREFIKRYQRQRPWLDKITKDDIVYISGPMSGMENHNKPAFWMMEEILKQSGCQVLSPAHHQPDMGYAWYMKRDIRMLCDATAMVLLRGWSKSYGAIIESTVAGVIDLTKYEEII